MTYVTVYSGRDHENLKARFRGNPPQPEQDEANHFYAALGQCIAAWQLAEASLYSVLEQLIRVSDQEASALSAAFHTAPNFRGRLDMTNAAAEKAMPTKELMAQWKGIYQRAIKKSKRRNAIAHSVVCFDPARTSRNGRFFLAPSWFDAKRMTDKGYNDPKTTIQRRELVDASASFMELGDEFLDIRTRVFDARAMRGEAAT